MKKSFPRDMKITDFLATVCQESSIKLAELQLHVGYPPQLLSIAPEAESLQELGIQSGSVISLRPGKLHPTLVQLLPSQPEKLEIDRESHRDFPQRQWKCTAAVS